MINARLLETEQDFYQCPLRAYGHNFIKRYYIAGFAIMCDNCDAIAIEVQRSHNIFGGLTRK